jgi:FkbM family methyltransferase
MDKQQLVNWCAQNTLNCFLYDRDCPGLAATCDQAIVSGRPLAVSRSAAFRHIHQYLEPYPRISLQRAIDESLPKIERIRKDWSPERFSCRFEEMLERYNTLHRSSSGNSIDLGLKSALSPVPSAPQTLKKRAKKVLKTLPIYTPIKNFYMSLVRRTKKSEKSEKGLISYAQIYEDIWLYRLFKYHTNGFYIDIGAYHPSLLSITKIFYDNGWRGINIEPNPTFFNEFLEQRPGDINLQMAVSNDEGEVPLFVQNDGGRAASLHAEWMEGVGYSDLSLVQVATKTLATVCEQYVPTDITIEFMSVDVGGHEKAVLESADWRKYRPRVIIIGATRPGKLVGHPAQFSENGLWMEWESILLDASYIPVQFDGLNKYYLRAEDIFLKEYFSVPVSSVLDGFKK